MSPHLIVRARSLGEVEAQLFELALECDVFTIDSELVGVAAPGRLIERVGNLVLNRLIDSFDVYELDSGTWHASRAARA